jgi:hypothetical protein
MQELGYICRSLAQRRAVDFAPAECAGTGARIVASLCVARYPLRPSFGKRVDLRDPFAHSRSSRRFAFGTHHFSPVLFDSSRCHCL